ncbi:hypothetical protein SAMN05216218_102133 [Halorientalis regularis]|uniref:Uncharacterized protein n=2 Tax=Halorientalis regularis TaxID=660518 RepID=A0A1G7GPS3_9EURY|nr:hypothetical protein SAMN05216218_102133 [Halorientalis regularis]
MWQVPAMRYLLPALVAVFVVTATVAVGTPALSPGPQSGTATQAAPGSIAAPVTTARNTTNYLELPTEDTRSRIGNASLDLGAAVATDSAQLQETFTSETDVEQFRMAPNSSAKTAVLRETATDLRDRTSALRQFQRRTIQQFDDGQISARVVFRRFAVIDSRARAIEESAVRIQGLAQFTPQYTVPFEIENRFSNARQRAGLFYTDPRQNIRSSLVGTRNTKQFLVQTGSSGIVLSSADSRRQAYLRESFIDNRFQEGGNDRFNGDITAAIDFVYDLYPWAARDSNQRNDDIDSMLNGVYQASFDHKHGELLTYLDGSNGEIFFETQEKRLSTLPVGETVTARNATADLTAQVNLSHPTGPIELTVRDTASGDAVDARILIDGQFVGTTGADGRLWTVQPRTSTRIKVIAGDDHLTFTTAHAVTGG